VKPQTSALPNLTLDSYVMHVHTHHCRNCTSTEQFSSLYEVWVDPRRPTTRQLKPYTSCLPLRGLHINYINLPAHTIPICSDCISTYHREAAATPLNPTSWAETIKRKYAPAPATPTKPAPAKVTPLRAIPNLEDL
jgi:hypothetical protein